MMRRTVVATAVEYDLPCVWIVWNNFAWGAIRDIQYGLFEAARSAPPSIKAIGPAAIATTRISRPGRAPCGADGITVTAARICAARWRGGEEPAPCVIDVACRCRSAAAVDGDMGAAYRFRSRSLLFGKPYKAG